MSDNTTIEWTGKAWQTKTAATRLGVTVEQYVERRQAGLKHCGRCRRWVAESTFNSDKSRCDGLSSICRPCRRAPPKQLALIPRTPAERDRHRYATDPVYRAERRQHAHARKRRVAPLPAIAAEMLKEDFGGTCAYCPARATTWDHLLAVAKGGRTMPGNIVPACVRCNSQKRDMDVFAFIEKRGIQPRPELLDALGMGFVVGELQ